MKINVKSIFDKIKWHLLALGAFFVISCIFYYPALQGYDLKRLDVEKFVGMSQEIKDYRQANGEEPLWTNAMFSGMPATQISTKYEGQWFLESVSNFIRLWLPSPLGFMFAFFVSFYFLALCFKVKPLTALVGAIAFGLSSYFLVIIEVGHNTKTITMAFTPFLIGSFVLAFREKTRWLGLALSAIFMGVQFELNHVQITYYTLFIILGIGIVYLITTIRTKNYKPFLISAGGIIIAYLIGFMANYGNLLGTLEYSPHTIRGPSALTINADGSSSTKNQTSGLDRDYITRWSYGIGETFTLMVPDFKGGKSDRLGNVESVQKELQSIQPRQLQQYVGQSSSYFGNQPLTSGPVYVGVIVLLLSILGIIYLKTPLKWAFLAVTILTIMLSWGKNFPFLTNFFLDYVPAYDKFRAVTIILVVAELLIPLLGVLFLSQLIQKRKEIQENMRPFFYASGGMLFILFLMWVAPTNFTSFLTNKEVQMLSTAPAEQQQTYQQVFTEVKNVRASILSSSVMRSILFLLAGGGLILIYLRFNLNKILLIGGLGLLIFVDLASYGFNFVNNEKKNGSYTNWIKPYETRYTYAESAADAQIMSRETQKNPKLKTLLKKKTDSVTSTWNKSTMDPQEISKKTTWWRYRLLNRNTNYRVYDINNPFNSSRASYFHKSIGGYHGAKLGRYQDLISFHISRGNQKVLDMLNAKYIIGKDRKRAQPRMSNLGNAWFIESIQWVDTPNEEIISLGAKYQIDVKNASDIDLRLNGQPFSGGEVFQNQKLEIWDVAQNPKTQQMDTTKKSIRLNLDMREGDSKVYVASTQKSSNWTKLTKKNQKTAPMAVQVFNRDSIMMVIRTKNVLVNGEKFRKGFVTSSASVEKFKVNGTDTMRQEIRLGFPKNKQGAYAYQPSKKPSAVKRSWRSPSSVGDRAKIILNAEKTNAFTPSQEAILNKKYKGSISKESYSGEGTIKMKSYAANKIKYSSNSDKKQFAVFSEIYYPLGWEAYIDGEKAEIIQTNYTLRGLEIPSGKHEIVFKYELQSYHTATVLAHTGSVLLLLILIGGFYMQYRENQKESRDPDN